MSNRIQPGNPGRPRRPKGSRNKLGEAFLAAVCVDFQAHGAAAIEAARVESRLGSARMVAALLPQKLEVDRGLTHVSDQELLAIIRGGGEEAPVVVSQ